MAGLIRKEPHIVDLFLASHQHHVAAALKGANLNKIPTKNPLFDCHKIEASIRKISLVVEASNENDSLSVANCSSEVQNRQVDDGEGVKCDCEDGERLILLTTLLTYFGSPVGLSIYLITKNLKMHPFRRFLTIQEIISVHFRIAQSSCVHAKERLY